MAEQKKILVNNNMPPKKKQIIKSSAILREIEEKKKLDKKLGNVISQSTLQKIEIAHKARMKKKEEDEKKQQELLNKKFMIPQNEELPKKKKTIIPATFRSFPSVNISVRTKGYTNGRKKTTTYFLKGSKTKTIQLNKKAIDEEIAMLLQKIMEDSPTIDARIEEINYNIERVNNLKKVDRSKMKIKQAGSMNLDGIIDNDLWNKNPNLCVPDWLMYQFRNKKGYIKKVKTKEIIEQYSITDVGLDQEPNKNGYTLEHIICFCANCNISLYALYNNEIIHAVQVAKCQHPLVIEIKNNHLYPIVDTRKKLSIIKRNVKSENIVLEKQEPKKELELEKVFQPNEQYSELEYIINVMNDRNLQPYPLDIFKKNSGIIPFKLGDELIIPSHYDELMEEYCYEKQINYKGQTPTTFINSFMGEEFPKSFMNQDVYDALTTRNVKNRTHLGFYGDNTECSLKQEHEYECYDINKCYRYCMENPKEELMTIQFAFEPKMVCEGFEPDKFGLWFVETDDITLLHKNNWYSTYMLNYAMSEGIVFEPKYFIKGKKEPIDTLNEVVDNVKNNFEDMDEKFNPIMKEMINGISGMLGKESETNTFMKIDNNKEEAWSYLSKQNEDEVVFFQHEGVYLFGKKQKTQLLSNNIPMYIQILDQSNIMLYELTKEVGGFENLVYRKTDFVMMKQNNAVVSPTDDVGGYKMEDFPKKFSTKEYYNVEYIYEKFAYDTLKGLKTSNDYKKVIKHLKKHSLMINAPAGTGKSFIIHKVVEEYGEEKCIKLAPTNIASRNIGGQTIHSFFQMGTDLKAKMKHIQDKVLNKEIIIIDEISMITGGMWSIIYQLKRNCKNLRFLLVGDEHQLPPIEEMIYDYFYHASIKYICDYFMGTLKLCRNSRYNKEMFRYLDFIRNGTIMDEGTTIGCVEEFASGRNICYTNKKRKEINEMVNKHHIQEKEHMFIEYFDAENPYNQDTYIYNDMEIMSIKTDKELQLTKNETYKIIRFDEEHITILNNDEDECCIPIHLFHKNFMMCYCITTHRSQGLTIRGRVNIHEYKYMKYNYKMCYTAISRATCLDNLKFY